MRIRWHIRDYRDGELNEYYDTMSKSEMVRWLKRKNLLIDNHEVSLDGLHLVRILAMEKSKRMSIVVECCSQCYTGGRSNAKKQHAD